MTEKSHFREPKGTLLQFGIKLILPKSIQNKTKMSLMLFLGLRVNQDIIKENNDEII
jgi:hypothetical protein